MIYFVEPNKRGDAHTVINACMLAILAKSEEVRFFGSRPHIEGIKKLIPADLGVQFSAMQVIDGSAKSWIFKESLEMYNLLRLLAKAKRKGVRFVFISSVFPMALYFLKVIRRMFPGVKIIIGLHGELEFVRKDKERKLRFLGFFLKKAFRLGGDANSKYLIYGESIRLNLVHEGLLREEEIIVIDHPYLYKVRDSAADGSLHSPLRFGSIGLATLNKRTHLIFKLAEALKDAINEKRVAFSIVGRLLGELDAYSNEYVSYSKEGKHMDRQAFDKGIDSLDYSLYFYDNSFYQLSASGALFDAISFEKPILALYNDYFAFYFKRLGPIGYLFEDLKGMEDKIASIINGECGEEYAEMTANMRNAKKLLSNDTISEEFWRQVDF